VAPAEFFAADPVVAPTPERPPWQRLLQGEVSKRVKGLEERAARLAGEGKFADALAVVDEIAELRGKVQGADHYEAVNARWEAEALRRALQKPKAVQAEYAKLGGMDRQGEDLTQKAKFNEALPLLQSALAIRRDVLGADHPATAAAYSRIGELYDQLGRFAEAEQAHRTALAAWREALKDEHPDAAAGYDRLGVNLVQQAKYAEAEASCRKGLAIRRKALGEEHPDTARSYNNVSDCLQLQGNSTEAEVGYRKALAIRLKALGERHTDTAETYNSLAFCQHEQGKIAEAEAGYEKALAIWRKTPGEDHPLTATAYDNLATILAEQGRFAEASGGHRRALDIRRKVLGEDHPDTAQSYINVAINLDQLGRFAEAADGHLKALAIRRRTLGEDHPDTATSYHFLAQHHQTLGLYAEAEAGFRRALVIRRKALGEQHAATAESYTHVAVNQYFQGKYAAAEEGFRKALDIYRNFSDKHKTALCYYYLAADLDAQGKSAEAEEGYQLALSVWRGVSGGSHPDMALAYNNLATKLAARGKYVEAEENFHKALDLRLRAWGEDNRTVAVSYGDLAAYHYERGQFVAAEENSHKALAIRRKVLGEEHPDTVRSYYRLAACLNARGRFAEAKELAAQAAVRFAAARLRVAGAGLDRATKASEQSPLPLLAAVLARSGQPAEAWQRFEESLARGTWDELSTRLRRPPDEQGRQAQLVAELERLDRLVEKAAPPGEPGPEQKRRREDLLSQRRQAQDALDDFTRKLETRYGAAAGQVFDRKAIQAALPRDGALVGWIDLPGAPGAADADGDHVAFLLRSTGDPVVVRLRGSGTDGLWSEADEKAPAELRAALQTPSGDWQSLANRLRRQRLEPLAAHLAARDGLPAARQLIVLPATALAGVPAESFADGYTVSYAPSGTLYAHLRKQPKPKSAGLLALADPSFGSLLAAEPPPPAPPGGLLLTAVVDGGNAARSGLKTGDVLLRYNGTFLASRADLKGVPESNDPATRVPVTVWRGGKTTELEMRPGRLGVVVANEPAPQALAAKYEADRWLVKSRAGDDGKWEPLPGTRLEAEGLRRLFEGSALESLVLAGPQASEQRLYDLAKSGELGKYRYLHLATHGAVDDRFPLRSAMILSRDNLPDPDRQLAAGQPIFDGRLTAEEVLRQWHLDCELATLSACQTGLGKFERGEGFIGFAQALLLAGSRSVCLSQWRVDDTATALLMNRFYENLLGKREGLKGPLGKAEALAEAKQWLRALTTEEATRRAAKLSDGVARGKRPKVPTAPAAGPAKGEEGRPFAHPYYWAAFVLIGDPD
jgi:tetratricopeptide (TPR) repeat protein